MLPAPLASNICLEVADNSTAHYSAVDFFGATNQRDPGSTAARYAQQFIERNRSLADQMGVSIETTYDGRDVGLRVTSGNTVGAVPLMSPISARPDFGLIVQPRFPWPGLGGMLASMGWRVSPVPLRLPLMHRSERRIPRWVVSSMILVRMKALLETLDRRFEQTTQSLPSPRGRVDWQGYASVALPRAQFLKVPCTFPELRDDRLLKGAIRHTIEQQIASLETQRTHGAFVHRLIEFALDLHGQVRDVPVHVPSSVALRAWLQRPLRSPHFTEGLQAIGWSIDERGLAGFSNLEGLPWVLPMESFFEAWVETVMARVAQTVGAHLRVGRKAETIHPIVWEPPYLGSQRSLHPDLWLEAEKLTVIVDAKYKRHFEEIDESGWRATTDSIRERHRQDLLQVLAYANLARTSQVIACLAYPCSSDTFQSLESRGRLIHQAEISTETRRIDLWLTAIPMTGQVDTVAAPLGHYIRDRMDL